MLFLFVLSGECSLGANGLLRFRTNDVLLGTSGVGVRFSVVSIQLFRPVNIFLLFFGLYRFRIHTFRPCGVIVNRSLTSFKRKRSCKRPKSRVRNSIV